MPPELLEPVVAGQTRFRASGLVTDPRGVAIGRELLAVLSTFDRVVGFLGACSRELPFGELFSTLTLERARQPGGADEFLVRFALHDSYTLDTLAHLAAPMRAHLFTGAGTVYVQARDVSAPFGYDLAQPVEGQGADVIAVGRFDLRRYRVQDRIDPYDLVLRLEPAPEPAPRTPPDMVLVLVAPGLRDRVVRTLWRSKTSFAGAVVALSGSAPRLLLRVRRPSLRVYGLLRALPGVECLRPVGPKMAVEVGYRHPFDLEALAPAFAEDEAFLFRARARRVERLSPPPRFVDGAHMVSRPDRIQLADSGDYAATVDLAPVRIELSLRRTNLAHEPRGLLVPRDGLARLSDLVRLLPPPVLASARLCLLGERVVLLATSLVADGPGEAVLASGALLPVGRRLWEAAPGVLVPDGYGFVPRIRPDLLRDLLGLGGRDHALFVGPDEPPLRLPAERFVPLDAALLASVRIEDADVEDVSHAGGGEATVAFSPMGRFALFGVPRGARPRAVEPEKEAD